jgi:hypothetical protein
VEFDPSTANEKRETLLVGQSRGPGPAVNLQDVWYRTVLRSRVRLNAASPGVPALVLRRLEDRIRELCAKTLIARGPELQPVLADLKSALHEHTERLRQSAVLKLVSAENNSPPERRST